MASEENVPLFQRAGRMYGRGREALRKAWGTPELLDPKGRTARTIKTARRLGKSVFSGIHHEAGMEALGFGKRTAAEKAAKGLGKIGLGRALGLGFLGMAAYEGYQEGGVGGAIMGVGKEAAIQYTFGRVASMAFRSIIPAAGKIAGAAAIGGLAAAGLYSMSEGVSFGQAFRGVARPWLQNHYRKHTELEMGSPIVDPYGTAATMRQRSVMAIQNSKLNGRGVLGNEASLMNSYWR